MCMWPPYTPNTLSKAIKNLEQPSKSWVTSGVKRIMGFAENYQEARRKAHRAEKHTDIESSTEQRKKRPSSKMLSSDSDEDELAPRKKQCSFSNIPEVPSQPPKNIFTTSSKSSDDSDDTIPVESENSFQEDVNIDKELQRNFSRNKLKPSAVEQTMLISMENIKFQLTHNQALLKAIMEQSNMCADVNVPELPGNIILPLNCNDEVDKLELEFENDELKKKMIAYLGTIGGHDTANTVRRIMATLLTNNCAKYFNMKGRGKSQDWLKRTY
uniref:DUF4806 domain-containing protein n=1 Tax=Ciona savignyi TaxID=51511 RepID=H2Y7Q0_CIOSA